MKEREQCLVGHLSDEFSQKIQAQTNEILRKQTRLSINEKGEKMMNIL